MINDTRPHSIREFDAWIRGRFIELNTQLEDLYAVQPNREQVAGVGDELKAVFAEEGRALIAAALPDLEAAPTDFNSTFEMLGNVGYYMAACRRHEITEPSRERTSPLSEASSMALQLGASLGMAPRFVTSHMQTHNRAVNNRYRTFTSREAEVVFLDGNTRSAFAYFRAADALDRIEPLGVSHSITADLLAEAERSLTQALTYNVELSAELDVDDFWFCVRPYYRPHRVGSQEFRGANAGDFAAFNQVDLLLGLCSATDTSYTQLVLEKLPYLSPDDQTKARSAFGRTSILDALLANADQADQPWFRANAEAFLRVCVVHGAVAAHHHDDLIAKFIEAPSAALPEESLENITASGPPLGVLLTALEKIRDQRMAADRQDIPTRHDDIAWLRALLEQA